MTRKKSAITLAILTASLVTALIGWRLFRPKSNVATLMQDAARAAAQRDVATASRLCDEVLQRDPDYVPALLLRADLAIKDGDHGSALPLLSRVDDYPAKTGAFARYGEGFALLELGRAREAEPSLLKSLSLEPGSMPAELKLRELYTLQLRRDDLRTFLRARRQIRAWGIPDVLDFIVAGHVPNLLLGNWLEKLESLAGNDPQDTHSSLALAQYYAGSGRYADSAETMRKLLARDGTNAQARALLADALLNDGNVAEARAALEQLPVGKESHPWTWRSRGRIALAEGEYTTAAEYLRAYVQAVPGDPAATYQLGMALDRSGENAEAAAAMRNGQQLSTLMVTAQRILKLLEPLTGDGSRQPDFPKIRSETLAVGQLMLDCELFEDATYCFELLLRDSPDDETVSRLHATALAEHRRRSARVAVAPPTSDPAGPGPRSVPAPSRDRGAEHPVRFHNVAAAAGVSFDYFTGHTGKKYLFETVGGPVAAIDFDGDGWTDLYFGQGSRFPVDDGDFAHRDQLYRNVGGQRFDNVTEHAALGDHEYTIGCAAADYDNDGFVDLFVANYGRNRAYRNNSDGTFTDVTDELGVPAPGMNTSLALADLDRDGDLDLYVVNYLAGIAACPDRDGTVYACHPSMFPAEQDVLLENLGDSQFRDVTEAWGMQAADGKGLGIVVADVDNDSWPDIYVANDTTPNFLFHNLGREADEQSNRFQECGLVAGAALNRDGQAQAGMGIACADLDANGFLDLYVTNFYLETNALYLNQGKLWFTDSQKPATLVAQTNPYLGFGTQAIDADLDGQLDLFVTNGHIDDYRAKDRNVMWKMPPKFYRNRGGLEFDDVSGTAGEFFGGNYLGRGVARLDWNLDTRPDLVVVHQNEPAALLENRTTTPAQRLVLELVGTASNREAVNARFWITSNGQRRLFEITGGDGYLATNERRQVIGLGEAGSSLNLEVAWPSGRTDSWSALPPDSLIRIVEGNEPEISALDRL
jgi:tetratricopeptide (TPR) repeat protein